MVAYCHLEIKETSNQLQEILNQQKTTRSYRKIQALYLLKTGKIKTVKELALPLGVHRVTVQKWFKEYRERGLESLLVARKKSGGPQRISKVARSGLKERLKEEENNGFKSYIAIQEWLGAEYGEELDYKTVHGLVRYRLKAKLKVP